VTDEQEIDADRAHIERLLDTKIGDLTEDDLALLDVTNVWALVGKESLKDA
jgi:hypothetical protein